jgi:hypothetical protein
MAKKFSALSWGRTRPGKSRFGRRPAASPGLTAERRVTKRGQFAAVIERAKAKKKAAETQAKRSPMPTGLMAASIKKKIKRLRKKEAWSYRKRHKKKDFYAYLNAVYRVQDWHHEKDSKRWAQKVAAMYEIKGRENKRPIHIIIDASCEQDRQVKSRWAIAVEYAVAMKVLKSEEEEIRKSEEMEVPESEFVKFLLENGGPAGCAAKMAALKKERAKRRKKNDDW